MQQTSGIGLRESLGHKAFLIVLVILAVGGVAAWYAFKGSGGETGAPRKAFFTIDDGATFFSDDATKIPPFDHNGKPAYGCTIFTKDGGKTKFVGSLYRFTPEGKKAMLESQGGGVGRGALDSIEVKKPGTGESGWVRTSDPRALPIQSAPAAGATQVLPD